MVVVVVLVCVGCAEAKDKLTHYITCPILWGMISDITNIDIQLLAISICNYLAPSHTKCLLLSLACDVYHSLKIGLRNVVDNAVLSGDFSHVIHNASRSTTESYSNITSIEFSELSRTITTESRVISVGGEQRSDP